jgi:hypothetical protein
MRPCVVGKTSLSHDGGKHLQGCAVMSACMPCKAVHVL